MVILDRFASLLNIKSDSNFHHHQETVFKEACLGLVYKFVKTIGLFPVLGIALAERSTAPD